MWILLMHNSFLFSFFNSACPTRFYIFCTWGPTLCEVPSIYAAGIYARCLTKKYPAYMPGTSQRGGPHHLFGRYPAYMLGSSRISQSTPITHADWLPITPLCEVPGIYAGFLTHKPINSNNSCWLTSHT